MRFINLTKYLKICCTIANLILTAENNAKCEINVSNNFELEASGKSEIELFGEPKIEIKKFTNNTTLFKK